MKIGLTGGHLTPALAVIEELKRYKEVNIFFVGRTNTMEGDPSPSPESVIIPNLGVKFYSIKTGRLQRKFTKFTLPSLTKIPFGFIQSILILLKEKPNLLISFGSYVAVPVSVAAWILRIPILTHEQTFKGGLANRFISKVAKRIAVSWESSIKHFPSKKVFVSGNPVRAEIISVKKKRTNRSVIYITGGNQGAHVINVILAEILSNLLKKYEVVHQCGGSESYKDFEMLSALSSQWPKKIKNRYKLSKWYKTAELAEIFSKTDLVVGRSGANIVNEVAILGIPAVFIPLEIAAYGEQMDNAKVLAERGAAIILPEGRLTPKRLLAAIEFVFKDYREYKKKAKAAGKLINKNAAKVIVDEAFRMVNVPKT